MVSTRSKSKILFLFFTLLFGFTNTFAETAPTAQTQYGNQNTQSEAANMCAQYSGFKGVYSPVEAAGGGSSVPVDLTQLRPYLISMDKNIQLTANEMRAWNMMNFCRIKPNLAAASAKIVEQAAKEIKTLADNCTTDQKCLLKRIYKEDVQKEVENVSQTPVYGRQIAQMLTDMDKQNPNKAEDNFDYEQIKKCNDIWAKGRNPDECVPFMTSSEDIITTKYFAARDRILGNQQALAKEFQDNGGVIGVRTCTKTYDNTDPSQVKWYQKNCSDFSSQPVLVTQEILKQITSLPFNQAFSPAAELGTDQNINNILTRAQTGNLIDPNISSNFGSVTGGSGATGRTTGGTTGGSVDLSTVQPNYNKLLANIKVITTLYDVAHAAYASSTSVCKVIPVQTRSATVARVDAAEKTYTDYATDLTSQWNQAQKTPNENHLDLVTRINFDLKDKYNQELINKVYDAVKALLQTCVDASAKAQTTTSTAKTN